MSFAALLAGHMDALSALPMSVPHGSPRPTLTAARRAVVSDSESRPRHRAAATRPSSRANRSPRPRSAGDGLAWVLKISCRGLELWYRFRR
jgi:hypothetical protein